MSRRQTLNAFAWWRDWWHKLSPFEQFFLVAMGSVLLALVLAMASMSIWPE